MIETARDTPFHAGTPEGIEYALHPAGLMARVTAYLLDSVISGIVMGVVFLVLILAAQFTGQWLLMIMAFLSAWFYHVGFEVFAEGQTPGKRIMGLRVVMPDGSPVSLGASFLRNVLRFADSFFSLYYVGFLVCAASPRFQRLGDLAAGTLVVYSHSLTGADRRLRAIWPPEVLPLPPPRPLTYGEKRDILAFARRYPWLGPGRADEIVQSYADSLGYNAGEASSPSVYILRIARGLAGAGR